MRKSIAIVILASTMCLLASCGGDVIVSDVANNVKYIANIRYTGYDESIDRMVGSICTEELAQEIKDHLQQEYERTGLIDVTGVVENATHKDISRNLDESIVEKDMRFYIDTSKVSFNYPDTTSKLLTIYDSSYEIKRTDIVQNPESFKENLNYKLEVQEYQYFKDGTLRVQLASSIKDNVLNNKQTIEVEVAKDGKIQEFDINDITSSLMYN